MMSVVETRYEHIILDDNDVPMIAGTTLKDDASDWEDAVLLDRARALGRVLFTRDDD